MIDTLADVQLEAEYIASMFLKGNIVSPAQTHLRMSFAQIPLASIGSDFDNLLVELRDEITDNFGLLKNSVMDAYLHGKQPNVFSLVESLYRRSSEFLPLMQQGLQMKEVQHIQDVEYSVSNSTDFVDMGNKLSQVSRKNENLEAIRTDMIKLIKLNVGLREIVSMYGSEPQKFPNMKDMTGNIDKYKVYIINLESHLDELVSDPYVAMKLGKAIESLGKVMPKDSLDPYTNEVFMNVIDILANPKDFYKDCKTEKIIGQVPGMLFASVYPQFQEKFMQMYLEDYESMTYQEQINFRNCFAIPADNSELLQLTNTYIKMSYT